ncbi:MAG: hypothetical protein WCK47_13380 [bacterium]
MALAVDLVLFVWLTILLGVSGRMLMSVFQVQMREPVGRLWIVLVSGHAVFSMGIFVLGIPGLFRFAIVASFLFLLTVFYLVRCFRRIKTVNHQFGRESDADRRRAAMHRLTSCFMVRQVKLAWRLSPLLFDVILIITALAFGTACAPEVRGDPIIYHITQALLFVVNHGHVDIPSSALTYIPQNQQLLYALALLLGGDSLARLLNWLSGVMLLMGAFTVSRLLGCGRRDAMAAAALVALFPIWIYIASACYVDLAAANYILASVFLLLCVFGNGIHAPIVGIPTAWMNCAFMSAIFMGMAMGTKYTAVVVGFFPALMVALIGGFIARRRDRVFSVNILSLFVWLFVLSLAVFSPWLIRNYLWTGNPVAPSFMRVLGPPGVPESTLSWPDIQAGDPRRLWPPSQLFASYADMLFSFGDYGNYLPLVCVILTVVALFSGPAMRARLFPLPVVLCIVFVVAAFLLGVPVAAVRRDSRYVMAHTAILAALSVKWCVVIAGNIPDGKTWAKRLGVGIIIALFILWLPVAIVRFHDLNETICPVFTGRARSAYLRARLANYDANAALGQLITDTAGKVLGAAYPARVNYVLGGAPITADYLVQNTEAIDPSTLSMLKRRGIRYIMGDIRPELKPYVRLLGYSINKPVWIME